MRQGYGLVILLLLETFARLLIRWCDVVVDVCIAGFLWVHYTTGICHAKAVS